MDLDNPYLRLALSAVLGAAIGWERTLDAKPAGLRTYALVSLGATTFLLAGNSSPTDVTRIVQGIVTGIGFLGAGSIVREGRNIHGLTSAASIWLAAALGVLCGAGDYGMAIYATVLTLVILRLLRWVEDRWRREKGPRQTSA